MIYDVHSGSSPLLVNVPHAGTELPAAIEKRLSDRARRLPDTDWHVHKLVEPAIQSRASLLVAKLSRYVIDLNRGPDDAPLYAGPTTGLIPHQTFAGDSVYEDADPDEAETLDRLERFWKPYHDKLQASLDHLRERYGFAVLFDVHSIRSTVPRLFEGRLPDLNLGTYDGRSCDADLERQVASLLAGADGFSSVANGRFKGGYITRHYGQPENGIHALQLEIAQDCYMDESRPDQFDAQRARPLMELLEHLVRFLSRWRPA